MEYRLHHRLSKFDRSVFLILKPISYFGVYMARFFLSRNFWCLLDHDLMTSIWEKAVSILAGNLNLGRSYLITAVQEGWGFRGQNSDFSASYQSTFLEDSFDCLEHLVLLTLVVLLMIHLNYARHRHRVLWQYLFKHLIHLIKIHVMYCK